ncbi:hypothetical protein AT15_07595 [Kosmotoga arenicorallina S304]|uniref:TRAM domain-containing protein n=1 Tax=Kosmotoga arenicorallina S304 TaxID=1453497 RepID=A0A176K2Z6_9BACT|nr:23S rRNA (uracil(1939)-C(5))-methyltransferase RlmD [Kosmotoga arenicorallina]OAA31352.1 hypothetical protein AT15_07595 [Kosmotoga arenicorallina S304]
MSRIFTIEKLVAGGFSLARTREGKIAFITGGYSGEVVEAVQVTRKKDFELWKPLKILKKSPYRRKKLCGTFPQCGGCDWQDLEYSQQLEWKARIIQEQFKRIAKIDIPLPELVPSKETHYRNKMEYVAFNSKNGIKLGFKEKASSKATEPENCVIGDRSFESLRIKIQHLLNDFKIKAYDPLKGTGSLKHLVLRRSSAGEIMAILVGKKADFPQLNSLAVLFKENLPLIDSLVYVHNSIDSVNLRGPYKVLYGEGILTEEIDGVLYQVPPTSFFQVNGFITREILHYIASILNSENSGSLLDLFAGVGFFSLYFGNTFESVTAVESSGVSIKALESNARINRINNIEIVKEDAMNYVRNTRDNQQYEVVILDPPRTGMGKAVTFLRRFKPKLITYVSCNPSTLARDAGYLKETGFDIISIKAFDMFPQTHHVETVVLMSRMDK